MKLGSAGRPVSPREGREEKKSCVMSKMSDHAQRDWNHQKLLSVFTGLLVLVGLMYGVTTIFQWRSMNQQARLMAQQLDAMKAEIENTRLNRSADLILKFDERLDKPPYPKLRSIIESGKPILKIHGGKFSTDDLEGYLGIFDSLNDLYVKNMVSKDLFYNEYSYDIERAYDHPEIQSFLKEIRKAEADYYIGFDSLAKEMKAATAAGIYAPTKSH
ncbi:MAG TPA: hypothetical protein VHE60_10750 [Pyrinomonadaceae bacterium]|nr:hypothetical protein [Pyrinomonadaceae bacterium]